MEGDGSRLDEAVLAALGEVMEVLRVNAHRAQAATARAASLRDRRLAGARYVDIVAEDHDALALESVTRNMTDLINAGAKLRRAAARALHAEGLTMEQIAQLFRSQLSKFESWIRGQPSFALLEVDYNRIVADPAEQVRQINTFLGGHLDTAAMSQVVDTSLYRNRQS